MLKTNIRIWIIVIVLFIVLDIILRNFLYLTVNENNLRPVKKDILSIDLIADKIDHDKKSKIAFLGDSQMYGSAVSNENDTIPGQFRKLIKSNSIHIYNLGEKGYGPGEVFYQLNHIKRDKFNIIIYNVSLGWLNRTKFTDNTGIGALNGLNSLETNDQKRDLIEYSRDLTHNFWYIRGHRYYLRYLISKKLGNNDTSDETLQKIYDKWDKNTIIEKLGNTNYVTKNINQINLEMLNKVFNQLDVHASKGTRIIIYISPQNIELFNKANLWNKSQVNTNIELIEKLARKHNFEFINYIGLIPGTNFVDTIHMDKDGNRLLANSLNKYINISRRAN